MERNFKFAENSFYHVFNRGVEKREIFLSPADYQRFVATLYLSNSEKKFHVSNELHKKKIEDLFKMKVEQPLVAIGAYCLMPNHFHLLLTPLVENGITKFMLKLQTGYSMYFNRKNDRVGSLFQGPYKARLAKSDEYLKYLYSYIHLNPAKILDKDWKNNLKNNSKVINKFVKDFQYSSFGEYQSGIFKIINPTPFPDYFVSSREVDQMVDFWLENKEEAVLEESLDRKSVEMEDVRKGITY